jgi:hypothetical protein
MFSTLMVRVQTIAPIARFREGRRPSGRAILRREPQRECGGFQGGSSPLDQYGPAP